jgi:hypothetical protein
MAVRNSRARLFLARGSRKGPYLLFRGRVSKPRSLWAHPDLHKGDSREEKEIV